MALLNDINLCYCLYVVITISYLWSRKRFLESSVASVCSSPTAQMFPHFISSIPPKNPEVITEKKKGFLSQTKRFLSPGSSNGNPGPGTYDYIGGAKRNNPSFSKNGTSGFPSKAPRFSHPAKSILGPTTYNLQSSFINKYSFGKGNSRTFKLPIAVAPDGPKYTTPAPNEYDVGFGRSERYSPMRGTSIFLSKTTRHCFHMSKNELSPWHYNVNDTITRKCPKVATSPFKSKTSRIPDRVDSCVPGPGTYCLHQATETARKSTRRRRSLLTLSEPPMIIPKEPPLPGPGQYNIVDYNSPAKQLMSSAVFVSGTSRGSQEVPSPEGPGPGSYDPQLLCKQSFLFRNTKMWLPA